MPLYHIYKNETELNEAMAEFICTHIYERLHEQEMFTLALTGGSTPKNLYKLLASDFTNKIDWAKVHVFIGDERFVPYNNARSNARMIFETLLQHVPVNHDHVYMMRTDISPAESAAEYEQILHKYFDDQPHSFDLHLLGLGGDGHTLSLFPNKKENNEKTAWCIPVYNDAEDTYRLTMTTPVVNASLVTVFLVSGGTKANAVSEVIKGKYDPDKLPAQLIKPNNNVLHWFLDKAAAEKLADITA